MLLNRKKIYCYLVLRSTGRVSFSLSCYIRDLGLNPAPAKNQLVSWSEWDAEGSNSIM